jgi:molybdenum cofactor synthesis domain-containing protein
VDRTAGILIIGNEILSGKVVDTNSPFLTRELRSLGVTVRRILTIPDDVDEIAAAVREFRAGYDLVFTSGGVGPTHDDVTIEGVARAFGRRVVRDPGLVASLEEVYQRRINDARLKMADVPEGAELLASDHLIVPVVVVENVHVFPGVPEIFRRKFDAIKERFRERPYLLRVVFFQVGEGTLAEHLNAMLRSFPELLCGSYPEFTNPEYKVRVTLESKEPDYLDAALRDLLGRLPADAVVRVQ